MAIASPQLSAPKSHSATRISYQHVAYRPVKLTQRGRRVVALVAVIPVLLMFLALGSKAVHAQAVAPTMTTVVVQSGQSLWDIAESVQPEADPRAVIYQIQHINGLESSAVFVGQQLVVPTS